MLSIERLKIESIKPKPKQNFQAIWYFMWSEIQNLENVLGCEIVC